MKNDLNIYSDINFKNLFNQLLPDLNIKYFQIADLKNERFIENGGLIIYDNYQHSLIKNLTKTNYDFLILTNFDFSKFHQDKNLIFLKIPQPIYILKDKINKFLSNQKIMLKNITVVNNKLINSKTNSFCFLTDIETKILSNLLKNKTCQKKEIKENILQLQSSIETNSLESHLTRLRKKLETTGIKIQLKSQKDILCLVFT